MSANADNVNITSLVWSDLVDVSSVSGLSDGGADIYLTDSDGDELNLELSEEAAIALRDHLLGLYPLEEDEDILRVEAAVRATDPGQQ